MQKVEQIRILIERGYSKRAVKKMLRVSHTTLHKALGIAVVPPGLPLGSKSWTQGVDWEKVRDEVQRRGTTLKQLHREWAPGELYLNFWREFRRHCPVQPEVSMRLVFKPGEKTQIDFTDGIAVMDAQTGVLRKTQLFVGVLAFSSRVYGEFTWDQKLPTFLSAHDRMWGYFGGVTPYVIPDNLKSGVSRADLYDPDVNPTYTEYANHMGFAVLPARPYHPRDKAKGESNINVIQRQFYQEVRDRVFYSLNDLNQEFWSYLKRLDLDVMKDIGVSRLQRFEEEVGLLLPLPAGRFEISEWRTAKVHPDCHIQVEKNFYSVPFQSVGRSVRVRVSEKLVEVFDEESVALAAHVRALGSGKVSTLDAHYPEHKNQVASFAVSHALAAARLVGEKTTALIEDLLAGPYPLKNLRRVQGILRLGKTGGLERESLEYAASQAMTFNKKRVSYIRDCAHFHQLTGGRPAVAGAPPRDQQNMYLHNESKEEVQ